MARTRSAKATGGGSESKGAKSGGTTAAASSTATYTLPEETKTPPRVFILPKKATSEARIVTLQNPRYSKPTRYLVCPEAGFFEFTKITAPKSTPRSWLLQGKENGTANSNTQVTKSADLYIASPIDPLFLILPALIAKDSSSGDNKKRMFLSSDDYFDSLSEMPDSDSHNHLSQILSWPKTRQALETRMAVICDTVEAGDEQMFRLNESKLLTEILSKAKRMAEHGLPKSMEEKFVTKALEAPILSVRSTQAAPTSATEVDSSGANTPSLESADSQSTISSVETNATTVSDASTAATSVSSVSDTTEVTNAMTTPAEVIALQKLRISFDFICSSYLPPSLSKQLKSQLSSSSSEKTTVDFKPLEAYLAKLAELRQKAAAARATTDYSRKRTRDEEDDERAEKKKKKEEEEKAKKANMSRGVRELKKVNTTGMKKLSEFFKKKS